MKKTQTGNNRFLKDYKVPNKRKLIYIYNSFEKVYNVQEGSVRSAKTTDNILAFAMQVENGSDELYLAIATTNSSARTIIFDGNGLGLKYYPDWQERKEIVNGKEISLPQRIFEGKYKGNDALILYPKRGSKMPIKYIVAFGGDNVNSHYPYRGWSIGMVIATEYDLLHPNTWQEIESRIIESKHRRVFIDFNPTDEEHGVYEKLTNWENSGRLNYIHCTLEDNPALTEQRIAEIKGEYDPDSIQFKRYILGQRISPHGHIYNVRDYNVIDNWDKSDYVQFIAVADVGMNSSATAFVLIGLRKKGAGIDVLREYAHKNQEKRGFAIKMPQDYAVDFILFCKECEELIGQYLYDRLIDPDITFKRELERIRYNLKYPFNFNAVDKEEIDTRIKTGINLLFKGRLRFYKECTETISSYKSAIYNPKKVKLGKYERLDEPQNGTKVDHIDVVEYGTTKFKNELQKYGEII